MTRVLKINNFYLGYGNEEILNIDKLELPTNTIIGLLGPSGSGKSSLINAIMQQTHSLSYWQKGTITFDDSSLTKAFIKQNIGYVPQKARLYTDTVMANFLAGITFKEKISLQQKKEFVKSKFSQYGLWDYFKDILDEQAIKQSLGIHKIILIIKAMILNPKLLLIDEVLASTSVKDELIIIDLIKKIKKTTTVLLITHNKEEAKDICDSIALVSGGLLHEHTPSEQFFLRPVSEIGSEFLESGSAWFQNPNTNEVRKEDDLTVLRRFSSMCEFYWILPEKLGGMQRPGLMTDLNDDLKIMKQLGVNVLVTLQQKTIDIDILKTFDIDWLHFPIVDMGVPTLEEMHGFILKIQPLVKIGKSFVYHCKAGMGRTGTLLACHLLWLEGISAIQAIEKIRHINYKYIQTDEQMEFVSQFEEYLKIHSLVLF